MASPRSHQLTTEGKGFSDKDNTWAKAWRYEGTFEITKKNSPLMRLGNGMEEGEGGRYKGETELEPERGVAMRSSGTCNKIISCLHSVSNEEDPKRRCSIIRLTMKVYKVLLCYCPGV